MVTAALPLQYDIHILEAIQYFHILDHWSDDAESTTHRLKRTQ